MPGENGFDLLKSYPQPAFKVIFTTAFQHFAAKAFRYSALDYLLKPIDPDELKQAVEKYKANRHPTEKNQVDLLQDNWEKLKQLEPAKGPINLIKTWSWRWPCGWYLFCAAERYYLVWRSWSLYKIPFCTTSTRSSSAKCWKNLKKYSKSFFSSGA